jgi:Sec-independent protein translocase protein TatA
MANFTEIALIVLIVLLVFGMGKLPQMAASAGSFLSKARRRALSEPLIDITPPREPAGQPGRKPGKFDNSVEEAKVEGAGPNAS